MPPRPGSEDSILKRRHTRTTPPEWCKMPFLETAHSPPYRKGHGADDAGGGLRGGIDCARHPLTGTAKRKMMSP